MEMTQKRRNILIGVLAVAVVIAACGIGYAVSPRDFLQLVLTDSAYTKYTLAKNLMEVSPAAKDVADLANTRQLAYETEGAIDVTFEDSLFSSNEIGTEVSRYINSLGLKSTIYVNDRRVKVDSEFYDRDGAVLNSEIIMGPSAGYVSIDQLNMGYIKLFGNPEKDKTDNDKGSSKDSFSIDFLTETYATMQEKGVSDDFTDALKDVIKDSMKSFDDTDISIDSKKTLAVGSVSGTGEVVTVIFTADDFKEFIETALTSLGEDEKLFNKISSCFPSDKQMTYPQFKARTANLAVKLTKKIDDSGIDSVKFNLYVNKKNEIVAVEMQTISQVNGWYAAGVLQDNEDNGMAIAVNHKGAEVLSLDIQKDAVKENTGRIRFMKSTSGDPLKVNASYSDFQMEDDLFSVVLITDEFTLPGKEKLGAVTFGVSVSAKGDALSLDVRTDIDSVASVIINLSGNKTEYKDFTIPKADSVVSFDFEKVKSKFLNYALSDLLNQHTSFKTVYSKIVQATINSMLNEMIGGLQDGSLNTKDFISQILGGMSSYSKSASAS